MITALVSTILGIAGGAVPKLIGLKERAMDNAQELAVMDRQAKLMEKQSELKLAEISADQVTEELKAFRSQMTEIYKQQKPIGIEWIDGWNSLLRPSAVSAVMILFVATSGFYIEGVLDQTTDMKEAAVLIWGSLIGEAIQAVLGYLFGYRSSVKAIDKYAAR